MRAAKNSHLALSRKRRIRLYKPALEILKPRKAEILQPLSRFSIFRISDFQRFRFFFFPISGFQRLSFSPFRCYRPFENSMVCTVLSAIIASSLSEHARAAAARVGGNAARVAGASAGARLTNR